MQELHELPDVQVDGRTRFRARLVALSVAVLFVGQLAYITIAEEPYPAIMMPRFSWAGPNQAGVIDISVPEITLHYADGKKLYLSQSELLREFSTGHHSSIMGSMFSAEPPATRRAPAGKYQPPAWLFPGYGLARIDRAGAEHVASLKAWLNERARQLYAAAPLAKCVVDWYDDSYPYETGGDHQISRAGHKLIGTFEIDLHADSTSLP